MSGVEEGSIKDREMEYKVKEEKKERDKKERRILVERNSTRDIEGRLWVQNCTISFCFLIMSWCCGIVWCPDGAVVMLVVYSIPHLDLVPILSCCSVCCVLGDLERVRETQKWLEG